MKHRADTIDALLAVSVPGRHKCDEDDLFELLIAGITEIKDFLMLIDYNENPRDLEGPS